MSKNTKTVKQPLSNGAKRAIWITAIIAVAVVVLVVSLLSIFNNDNINPDNNNSGSTGSSSLKISNGDFLYVKSDSENARAPFEAQDWLKKTYKDGSNFGDIEDETNVVMGVVNTTASVWNDTIASVLTEKGLTVTNPGTHSVDGIIDQAAVEEGEVDIANVYMIAAKTATSASILSKEFSIPASKSVKISVWINTSQLTGKASVMIQKSSETISKETYFTNTQYWYAYDLEIEHTTTEGANGWQLNEFYVFNRSSKSAPVRLNVGLGDVYHADATATGTLFIDDITYEEVTSNEYRKHYETTTGDHTSYIVKPTDTDEADVKSLAWAGTGTKLVDGEKTGADIYLEKPAAIGKDGEKYSPFVTDDKFDVYEVTSSQSLSQELNLYSASNNRDEYVHFYFWMRVVEGTQNPQASIVDFIVRDKANTNLDKSLTTIKNIAAVEDITKDDNCGWKQYHLYVKPDQDILNEVVTLEINWADTGLTHNGVIYVSEISYEIISDKDYTSGTSNSTTSVKADMSKSHASTGVTNGTFGYLEDTDKTQPENWTHVFAGFNEIYNDGKGDDTIANLLSDDKTSTVGSGLVTDGNGKPDKDDAYGYYLSVTNAKATSHGYISSNVSLSAKSVYRVSVLAKGNPYIYLINRSLATAENGTRANAVIGKFETEKTNSKMDELLLQNAQPAGNGWVRYYFIVETADEALTLNIALFNGKLDGSAFGTAGSSVYYDQVYVEQLGSYAMAEDTDNEDATLQKVTYTEKVAGYADLFDTYFADIDGDTTARNTIEFKDGETPLGNVQVIRVADDAKWNEMRQIPEEEEEEVVEDEDTTTDDENKVDVALLMSVISSVLLVAALLVVLVIRLFKKRRA